MRKVQRSDIVDYQTYGDRREELRGKVLEEKAKRRVHVGDSLTFLFENTETIRYQIQEMMRIENIVRDKDIQHEIDTYNELLGDRGELGCTLLIEIDDPAERDEKLRAWTDLPKHLYVKLDDGSSARAVWDARQVGEDRLSSVQYLKFPIGNGTPVAIGADHPRLVAETLLTTAQRDALREDAQ